MRLHFNLTPNKEMVPFDYQHFLIGTFHKWMGWNEIHDEISLYSLSWLHGGKMVKDGFNFPKGAKWFISFWDEEIGKQLIMNAMKDPVVCCGMLVKEIQIQETPQFGAKEKFIAASPIFIRKYDENRKAIHLTTKDDDVDYYLTETLKKKLKTANLNYDVKVTFDKSYYSPKTKLVKINGIENKANFCPVIVEGHPEAVKFAWNVGVGHSTGCGFGALG
ncbi:CRISPR-associated endoribonuclease Cas6 [Melioribacteraceae bacterium 4301-Me]|uniref:CRISPR-associated endoribonuclease Cas6 n=1 Tax=Pyranulibacter aquaticus TaxID=3163344 RepID=UPI003597092F